MLAINAGVEFINTCLDQNIPITYFKLQKLLYLCQGLYLKTYGVPLFPENFFNWSLGPGIKPVARKLGMDNNDYTQDIDYPKIKFASLSQEQNKFKNPLDMLIKNSYFIDQQYNKKLSYFLNNVPKPVILFFEKEQIDNIINTFGYFNFFELLNLQKQGNFLNDFPIGKIIPNETILNHYLYMEHLIEDNLQNILNKSPNINEINLGIIKVQKP